MTYPNATHASEHFSWKELRIDDYKKLPGVYQRNALKLVGALEKIRAKFGPVTVTSGYRDSLKQMGIWKEALAKYGSEQAARLHVAPPGHSQHELAAAADIVIPGVPVATVAAFAATLSEVGGVGIYPADGFVHVDVRPREGGVIARW